MKKFIKKFSTILVTTGLICSLTVPAFAEEAIVPVDAENVAVTVENDAQIERGLQSRYVEDKLVLIPHSGSGVTPPSTYFWEETYGGYEWSGTLKLSHYSMNTSYVYAYYDGYLYANEE